MRRDASFLRDIRALNEVPPYAFNVQGCFAFSAAEIEDTLAAARFVYHGPPALVGRPAAVDDMVRRIHWTCSLVNHVETRLRNTNGDLMKEAFDWTALYLYLSHTGHMGQVNLWKFRDWTLFNGWEGMNRKLADTFFLFGAFLKKKGVKLRFSDYEVYMLAERLKLPDSHFQVPIARGNDDWMKAEPGLDFTSHHRMAAKITADRMWGVNITDTNPIAPHTADDEMEFDKALRKVDQDMRKLDQNNRRRTERAVNQYRLQRVRDAARQREYRLTVEAAYESSDGEEGEEEVLEPPPVPVLQRIAALAFNEAEVPAEQAMDIDTPQMQPEPPQWDMVESARDELSSNQEEVIETPVPVQRLATRRIYKQPNGLWSFEPTDVDNPKSQPETETEPPQWDMANQEVRIERVDIVPKVEPEVNTFTRNVDNTTVQTYVEYSPGRQTRRKSPQSMARVNPFRPLVPQPMAPANQQPMPLRYCTDDYELSSDHLWLVGLVRNMAANSVLWVAGSRFLEIKTVEWDLPLLTTDVVNGQDGQKRRWELASTIQNSANVYTYNTDKVALDESSYEELFGRDGRWTDTRPLKYKDEKWDASSYPQFPIYSQLAAPDACYHPHRIVVFEHTAFLSCLNRTTDTFQYHIWCRGFGAWVYVGLHDYTQVHHLIVLMCGVLAKVKNSAIHVIKRTTFEERLFIGNTGLSAALTYYLRVAPVKVRNTNKFGGWKVEAVVVSDDENETALARLCKHHLKTSGDFRFPLVMHESELFTFAAKNLAYPTKACSKVQYMATLPQGWI